MAHKPENVYCLALWSKGLHPLSYTISLCCGSDFDLSPPEHLLCSELQNFCKPHSVLSQGAEHSN